MIGISFQFQPSNLWKLILAIHHLVGQMQNVTMAFAPVYPSIREIHTEVAGLNAC